jgi:hypothetical protein
MLLAAALDSNVAARMAKSNRMMDSSECQEAQRVADNRLLVVLLMRELSVQVCVQCNLMAE